MKKLIDEADIRETIINGLVKIGEPAIPLMTKCLVTGHASDKIVRSLSSMKKQSITYLNEEIAKSNDKTVLNSILKLIESKE